MAYDIFYSESFISCTALLGPSLKDDNALGVIELTASLSFTFPWQKENRQTVTSFQRNNLHRTKLNPPHQNNAALISKLHAPHGADLHSIAR